MIDFFRRAAEKERFIYPPKIDESKLRTGIFVNDESMSDYEELCEALVLALRTCDYEYVSQNLRKLWYIHSTVTTSSVFDAIDFMAIECLTLECWEGVQEQILALFEVAIRQRSLKAQTTREFVQESREILFEGKRSNVIQRILSCLTLIVRQNADSVEAILSLVDWQLIVSLLETGKTSEQCQDSVVDFLQAIVTREPSMDFLQMLVQMLTSRDFSVAKLNACSWIIISDERSIQFLDLKCIVELVMQSPEIKDQLKLLVLSVTYEHIKGYGRSFVPLIFPLLHSPNEYLAASGFFTLSCFLESCEHGADYLVDTGFLEHVLVSGAFLVKRECTRCLCKVIQGVTAFTMEDLVTNEMVTLLIDMLDNVDNEMSLDIIRAMTILVSNHVVVDFVSSVNMTFQDASVDCAFQNLVRTVATLPQLPIAAGSNLRVLKRFTCKDSCERRPAT